MPEGFGTIWLADPLHIKVELLVPIGTQVGLRFTIRAGGPTVGAGVITEMLS
ncbi:MAG: hypothetical protein JSW39_09970 [Desulfobacterales bacterium]|nr:MAG: hypothetical protein JSW39_09970 [Desulfobacterales bacterium]